jgi:hypothetical protein
LFEQPSNLRLPKGDWPYLEGYGAGAAVRNGERPALRGSVLSDILDQKYTDMRSRALYDAGYRDGLKGSGWDLAGAIKHFHFPPARFARGSSGKVALIGDDSTKDDSYDWIFDRNHVKNIHNWASVVEALKDYKPGSITVLVLSGHGAGGGIRTKDKTSLKGSNLTEEAARIIREKLAPNGVIVIASCGQGADKFRKEIQEMAKRAQRAVYVTPDAVCSNTEGYWKGGGYAEADPPRATTGWIRVDPP